MAPYTRAKWPNWNSASNCYVPDAPVLGCPAYDRIPGRRYEVAIGSYGYNGGGVRSMEDLSGSKPPVPNGLGLIPNSIPGLMSSDVRFSVGPRKESDVVRPCDMIVIGDSTVLETIGDLDGVGYLSFQARPAAGGFGPCYFGGYNLSPVDIVMDFGAWYLAGLPIARSSPGPFAQRYAQACSKRHDARFNISFGDGHTEGLKVQQLFDYRQDAVLQRWNFDNQPHRERLYGPLQ